MSASAPHPAFDVDECRARFTGFGNYIDCLSAEHAMRCDHSLSFGYGSFCMHPQGSEIVETTKRLHEKIIPPDAAKN